MHSSQLHRCQYQSINHLATTVHVHFGWFTTFGVGENHCASESIRRFQEHNLREDLTSGRVDVIVRGEGVKEVQVSRGVLVPRLGAVLGDVGRETLEGVELSSR